MYILYPPRSAVSGQILMIGHTFGSGYHTTLVKLFGGHSSTMEPSLQLNILESSVFIQHIISEWPASGGGQLHDPIQYLLPTRHWTWRYITIVYSWVFSLQLLCMHWPTALTSLVIQLLPLSRYCCSECSGDKTHPGCSYAFNNWQIWLLHH